MLTWFDKSSCFAHTLGLDWDSVPNGGLVVDVGAGVGNVALQIARARPDLHIVIEDRPPVIEQAKKVRDSIRISLSEGKTGCILLFF